MRRLWSHIILAATSLLMVGATFATVVTNIDSNIEYEKGKELVFRVVKKDAEDEIPNYDYDFSIEKDHSAVESVAKTMDKRLKTADISRYEIETQGYDTVKVRLVQENDQQYEIIRNYLSFNATLALSNSKETVALMDDFLNKDEKAYLETSDTGYPTIVIPINYDNEYFQAVYTEAKDMADNNTGEYVEPHDHEEGEEETEEVRHAYLYLWYDYIKDYYSFSKIADSSSEEYDKTIASKILMTFDAADPFLDDEHDALRTYVRPSGEESTEVTADSLKKAYENARFYINLLNAGTMDNYVEFMFQSNTDMLVESLVALDAHMTVAWSRTFMATLCAIVVVSLLLVYFYRLGASSIATVSIVSTFFGLLFVVLFGAEFNIAGIIGLISLAFTSVLSGIIYLNKFKEECYRGRALKKANSEAAKKALLPTIDIHVVLVAMGVACYLLGGVLMKGFALVTILGGLVSLVLNLAGLRGLMWLVTNEQGLNNRYDLFDVSEDQVPNALEEEKQKYYGANVERDYTKHKKPVAIASLVLLVASIAGLITWGIIRDGAVYRSTNPNNTSQVYVEYYSVVENDTALSTDTVNRLNTMLKNTSINGKSLMAKDNNDSNPSYNLTVDSYEYTTKYQTTAGGLVETKYYAYYRIDLPEAYTGNETITYKNGDTVVFDENAPEGDAKYMTMKDFFSEATLNSEPALGFNSNVTISFKDSVRANADQPEFKWLIVATTVGSAIAALYMLLRYRLSRGLASLALVTFNVGITAGLFCLMYLPVTSYVSVALPFVALFSYGIAVLFMNKEREMVLEDRSRDNSIENREKIMKRALAISSTPITIAFIIALYLGVNFFGFMFTSVSWVFLLMILGVAISTALALILFGPCAHVLYKWFSGVKIIKPRENKKKKARPVRVNKSAEPEEAIFIGIND